jgi:cytosine/adenosine deaminase-related metal-dependent hydrolase
VEDVEDSLRRSGKRVIYRLQDAGVLGPRTIVAHAVHTETGEHAVLARTKSWVTHQPRSNMNNAVGTAPVLAMLQEGVDVALGNDGFSNNMFAEMKAAYLVHKLALHDPSAMPADLVFNLAFDANARLARAFWPQQILGEIAPGATADIILVDYEPTTPLNAGNLPWHFIFGYEASMITTTISAGRVLMRHGQLLTLDEEEITARARELAEEVWERPDD